MAPRVGFEPTTYRLTAGRSTVELSRKVISCGALIIIAYKYRTSQPFKFRCFLGSIRDNL